MNKQKQLTCDKYSLISSCKFMAINTSVQICFIINRQHTYKYSSTCKFHILLSLLTHNKLIITYCYLKIIIIGVFLFKVMWDLNKYYNLGLPHLSATRQLLDSHTPNIFISKAREEITIFFSGICLYFYVQLPLRTNSFF